jgi:hypothetical protein
MHGPRDRTKSSFARVSFLQAAATLVTVVASFLTVYALCRWCGAQPGPAILAAILAMTLSRRAHPLRWSRTLTEPLAMACTALAATGAAWLLHAIPLLGAVVFVAVMFLSVWLRNFGERERTIGTALALPLVVLLIAPARANAPGGPLVDLALVVCAGVVALAYAQANARLSRRFGLAPAAAERAAAERASLKRPGISVPTRMALQMAVALSAAFAAGFLVFPDHWGWCVLTAFIVCSGARGRGDAAYKGLLRLGGAVAGTLAAPALARIAVPSGIAHAVLIFVVLFFGLWLRAYGYAYWAACITLVLALLSQSSGESEFALLAVRLEAILVGALCAVAAAWFVFPIRTEAVIRRRLADALGALDGFVAREPHANGESKSELALFEHRMTELDSVAVPVRWHRRVFGSAGVPEHPALWIELAHEVKQHARSFVPHDGAREKQRGAVRRAIGASRRAIAEHGKADSTADELPVSVALRNLRDVLQATTKAPEAER